MPTRKEKQWLHHKANQQMRPYRKKIERNRKPQRVRRKDWLAQDPNALEYEGEERLMPRGEYERRLAAMKSAVKEWEEEQIDEPGCAVKQAVERGRIAAVRYGNYRRTYETLLSA